MPFFKSFDRNKIFYKTCSGNKPYSIFILQGLAAHSEFYEPIAQNFNEYNIIFWNARSQICQNSTITDLA